MQQNLGEKTKEGRNYKSRKKKKPEPQSLSRRKKKMLNGVMHKHTIFTSAKQRDDTVG